MQTLNRYLTLAQMVIAGGGLPFLGAGISIPANTGSNDTDTIEPDIGWMIDQLIKEALPPLLDNQDKKNALQFTLTGNNNNSSEPLSPEKLKTWVSGRLGFFCDAILLHDLITHREIVDCLQISQFAKLNPHPRPLLYSLSCPGDPGKRNDHHQLRLLPGTGR